eukprot:GILJ01012325.1.p1 GENE.GILJ01012325.1~~GILJ01012325.1.p1  ORF type:complete len:369 (+),score=43.96 GILJ01012325.1:140-1246(+)
MFKSARSSLVFAVAAVVVAFFLRSLANDGRKLQLSLSCRFVRLFDGLSSIKEHEHRSIDFARFMMRQMHLLSWHTPVVFSADQVILVDPVDNVTVRIYSSNPIEDLQHRAANELQPVIVYFHGGGWTLGDIDSHDGICRRLTHLTGFTVVSVHYRRAPQFKFPTAAEDAYMAVRWVVKNHQSLGIDPFKVVVAGDSAGGNLAAVSAMLARDRQEPSIALQVLIYPVVAGSMVTPSVLEPENQCLLTGDSKNWFWLRYTTSMDDMRSPYAAPLFATTHEKLPSAVVLIATYDVLRDEGIAYVEALQRGGVSTRVLRYDDIHGFFGLDITSYGTQAVQDIAAAIVEHFQDGGPSHAHRAASGAVDGVQAS